MSKRRIAKFNSANAFPRSDSSPIDACIFITYAHTSMKAYKRNQVEEAISRLAGEKSGKPSSELRTRLKRLLDLDRNLGRQARSADPEKANYAFYSGDSPGKGIEVWFSEYEAFALSLGLRLLRHGWPQSFVIAVLRRLRPALEAQHARFLKQDPGKLFDKEAIRKHARPGDLGFDNSDPVLLTIVTQTQEGRQSKSGSPACTVCRGMKQVAQFLRDHGASSWSLHELVTPGHALARHLEQIPARRRGRGS